MKKIQNIYDKSMAKDKEIVDFFKEFEAFTKYNKTNKYPFDIKYLHSNSELSEKYNLPRKTECFFVNNTLFIISNHLQHKISAIADAAYFLITGIIKDKDLDNIFNYLNEDDNEVLKYHRLKYSDLSIVEAQHYIAKYYLFLKKIEHDHNDSTFFKMMLKSRRILSKIHNNGEIEKDIEYLLNKKF